MTGAAFRKLALSFEGAHEEPHFDRTSFRVGKRIFATMTSDEKEAMVPVKPLEQTRALLEARPEMFFSHGGFTDRFGSLGVRLAKADAKLVATLMQEAWERVKPKPARRTSGASRRPR
jgi:hypothetical protein